MKSKLFKDFLLHVKKNRIHEEFDFSQFNRGYASDNKIPNCKTSGCMAGELPGFSSEWTFNESGNLQYLGKESISSALGKFFDLTRSEVSALFFPINYGHPCKPQHEPFRNHPNASFKKVFNSFKKFYEYKTNSKFNETTPTSNKRKSSKV